MIKSNKGTGFDESRLNARMLKMRLSINCEMMVDTLFLSQSLLLSLFFK